MCPGDVQSIESKGSEGVNPIAGRANDFLTIYIAGQLFGIPVLQLQDVLGDLNVSKIPLAPPEVDGSLNLRGRIVTSINVRRCLGLSERAEGKSVMSVVVEHEGELYSLTIDEVGDVLALKEDSYEKNPVTLDPKWRGVSLGIYRLEEELLIVLDVPKLINDLRI
ncbi:MAG: chemotaxis protein CheW [Pseudomonadota bacterium]|jgi:purine-binding chemotaxis protein CheW|nr:chemotaxis protein CheW [Pseudomonadota bacterium]